MVPIHHRYGAIISYIDIDAIYSVIAKSRLSAPEKLNYSTAITSIFIHYIGRIPTIKDLIKRLNEDIAFKLNCGFLVFDNVPSKASYSRFLTKLSESDFLEKVQEIVVLRAISEGFIIDDTIAIDTTYF